MIQPVLKPQTPKQREVLTVSQLNQKAKYALESQLGSIWLSGEISNLTRAASGHWYFSLKDDNAQIRAAMFRFKAKMVKFTPKEGDQVVVKGKVSLYEARGDYQLIADFMEPAGVGDLQQKLRELIEKLQHEGLLNNENKQPLPKYPKKIGIITSPTGAAIFDALTVLQRRSPMTPIVIYPTQVQGASAAAQIKNALNQAISRNECDVLLITRGGGSIEDLWCFNDESLAHDIFNCPIPTVAAIGHEVDITLAELVADLRAPTPSAAAELLVEEQTSLQQKVDILFSSLNKNIQFILQEKQSQLNYTKLTLNDPASSILQSQLKLIQLQQRLQFTGEKNIAEKKERLLQLSALLANNNPTDRLNQNKNRLAHLSYRLNQSINLRLVNKQQFFEQKIAKLHLMSPLATLGRGYSIIRNKNKMVINSINKVKPNEMLELLVEDGSIKAKVDSTFKD